MYVLLYILSRVLFCLRTRVDVWLSIGTWKDGFRAAGLMHCRIRACGFAGRLSVPLSRPLAHSCAAATRLVIGAFCCCRQYSLQSEDAFGMSVRLAVSPYEQVSSANSRLPSLRLRLSCPTLMLRTCPEATI